MSGNFTHYKYGRDDRALVFKIYFSKLLSAVNSDKPHPTIMSVVAFAPFLI
jgi:hypothetical protein